MRFFLHKEMFKFILGKVFFWSDHLLLPQKKWQKKPRLMSKPDPSYWLGGIRNASQCGWMVWKIMLRHPNANAHRYEHLKYKWGEYADIVSFFISANIFEMPELSSLDAAPLFCYTFLLGRAVYKRRNGKAMQPQITNASVQAVVFSEKEKLSCTSGRRERAASHRT